MSAACWMLSTAAELPTLAARLPPFLLLTVLLPELPVVTTYGDAACVSILAGNWPPNACISAAN
jgi:hypothetical protein